MDDCEEEKNFDFKGKILKKVQYLTKIFWIFFNFLTDTLSKKSQNIVAYSFVSEHSKYLFLMLRNKLAFLSGEGGRPLIFKWYTFYRKNLYCLSVYLKFPPGYASVCLYLCTQTAETTYHPNSFRKFTCTTMIPLFIYTSIYLSFHPSIYLSIYLTI